MPKVIFKCNYIKSGKAKSHLNNLVNYIATRDGVQKLLIEDAVAKKENYVEYISNRPRVEKISTHGLFTSGEDEVDLEKVTKEVANHSGNIWTPIISLTREDAVLTGMDNAESWKLLVEQQAMMIAENLKIPFNNFKWYAAFHDESYHPHIHMVCYSTDPTKGYLTQNGIDNIRSSLTREIFSKELNLIYAEKTVRRDKLKEKSKEVFDELKEKIASGEINNPQLELLMSELKEKLDNTTGKKVYGYLKPNAKEIVDKIVDELEYIPEIKNCYDLWWEMQQEIYSNYQDKIIKPLPLSKQTEFKSIKNMIISELVKEDNVVHFENIQSENINIENESLDVQTNVENENQNNFDFNKSTLNILNSLSRVFENENQDFDKQTHPKLDSQAIREMRKRKQALGQKLDLKEMKL
ncbi:MAG: MobP3 family relaxase [Clostridia bacterium]